MSSNTEVDAFIEHFGVKGMHWGVRNESKKPKAKIFVPMTKEERQTFRRSSTAKKARRDVGVLAGKVAASISVGMGAGYVARRIASKHMSLPAARIVGYGTSFIASDVTGHILDINGKRKIKSLQKKQSIRNK